MPTAKGKGGSASHRYRPASEYDDATLAQRREYWRNKKREQRARLSERRGGPAPAVHGEGLTAPSEANPAAAPSSPADEANKSQRGGWLQPAQRNREASPASCSGPTKVAGGDAASGPALCRAFTSASGTQPNTGPSVPPVRVTRAVGAVNGGSAKTAPRPRVSMQGASVPKPPNAARSAPPARPRRVPPDTILLSPPPRDPLAIKKEGTAPAPQSGTQSALVAAQGAGGSGGGTPQPAETEEERAARRREHWRIKKREQRAKLAARLAKPRDKPQEALHRPPAPGVVGAAVLPQAAPRLAGQRQWSSQVKCVLPPARRERSKPQTGTAGRLPADPAKPGRLREDGVTEAGAAAGGPPRRTAEPARRPLGFAQGVGVTRGIARCKTPRQRFAEAQRSFLSLRSLRCKLPLAASAFAAPKARGGHTPEQALAERREYWRVKKREQRAKLSLEVKARLKEKDSLMRRVKRYQKILEEMRRARAQASASEAIGGFIEEDGTLTAEPPRGPAAGRSAEGVASSNQPDSEPRGVPLVRVKPHPPPPPLRPAQVKVSFPLAGQSARRPPSLLSARPRAQPQSTTSPNSPPLLIQTVGQLTLSRPPTPDRVPSSGGPAAGPAPGGCVMKMAVSCRGAALSALSTLSLDPALTEEERMAKKREYWRLKKREQRAARAVRLKQGAIQARAIATLQRRRAQRLAPPPAGRGVPAKPHADEIKHERESPPAVDLLSPPQRAICPGAAPPPPPPAPQPDADPALSADSQATTLLAVASMKKLLEESLSTVTDNIGPPVDIKVEEEEEEEATEEEEQEEEDEAKPGLPQLLFQKEFMSPIAADLTLQIKSWQAEDSGGLAADIASPACKTSPPPPAPPASDGVPRLSCQYPPQTPARVPLEPPVLVKNTESRTAPSPPPPPPPKTPHRQLLPRLPDAAGGPSGLNSLQKKREYWKLMKRQQRARLKARQKERPGECGGRLSLRSIQTPGLVMIKPKQPAATSGVPTAVLLVSQSPRGAHQLLPPATDMLHVKLPVDRAAAGPPRLAPGWPRGTADADPSPALPTLRPPDNPLSSMNLQPIEPAGQSPVRVPRVPAPAEPSPNKLASIGTTGPPKRVPGETEEDFLRRKREYWRIKKKEQRARKAIQEKGPVPRRAPNSSRPLLPAQEPQTRDCGQWADSSEDSEHLVSMAVDSDPGSLTYDDYLAPVEDESELLFADYEGAGGEDGSVSDGVWRSRYLMDYDPLNQLLVCMVCGELQYSHGLEGARAHIDEAHPQTLALEPGEKRRILEAWDEQVSRRERFFTSQLQQQHGGALAEAHRN